MLTSCPDPSGKFTLKLFLKKIFNTARGSYGSAGMKVPLYISGRGTKQVYAYWPQHILTATSHLQVPMMDAGKSVDATGPSGSQNIQLCSSEFGG